MNTTPFLSCLCLGLTLFTAINCDCPPVEELHCNDYYPCTNGRTKIYSYIPASPRTGQEDCPACSYCVPSADECPSLPCHMLYIPPTCNPVLYPLRIKVGERVCNWRCEALRCLPTSQ